MKQNKYHYTVTDPKGNETFFRFQREVFDFLSKNGIICYASTLKDSFDRNKAPIAFFGGTFFDKKTLGEDAYNATLNSLQSQQINEFNGGFYLGAWKIERKANEINEVKHLRTWLIKYCKKNGISISELSKDLGCGESGWPYKFVKRGSTVGRSNYPIIYDWASQRGYKGKTAMEGNKMVK